MLWFRGKAYEAVEMGDGCHWGESANLLMETTDDAKYHIADMKKVFGLKAVARNLSWPTISCRWEGQWKNQEGTKKKKRKPNPNPINSKLF